MACATSTTRLCARKTIAKFSLTSSGVPYAIRPVILCIRRRRISGPEGRNLFLRSVANRILPGQTAIADGTTLPNSFGVVNRTNTAGQVIAVNTIREFSIVSGTSSVLNPFAEVDYKTSGGHDSYKALQLSLTRRFSKGVTLNAQYSFARSFGNTAGSNEARTAANNARSLSDFDYDEGYNNFDVRH